MGVYASYILIHQNDKAEIEDIQSSNSEKKTEAKLDKSKKDNQKINEQNNQMMKEFKDHFEKEQKILGKGMNSIYWSILISGILLSGALTCMFLYVRNRLNIMNDIMQGKPMRENIKSYLDEMKKEITQATEMGDQIGKTIETSLFAQNPI